MSDQYFNRRVGSLLYWANSNPGATCDKQGFYRLKQAICERYGRRDGTDIQQIRRECWDCGGTGRDWIEEDYCSRCGGDGVYEWVYVELERWRVGQKVFHRPVGRVFDEHRKRNASISGLIKHKESPFSHVAAIALAKLFNTSLYWKWLQLSLPADFGQLVSRSTRLAEMSARHHPLAWRLEIFHTLLHVELPPVEERF